MIERGQDLGFPLEPSQPFGIPGEQVRRHLDRDLPAQPGVLGTVDLAHAPAPNGATIS